MPHSADPHSALPQPFIETPSAFPCDNVNESPVTATAFDSRAQDFQQPEAPFSNDTTIAGSGGQGQAVANLTLPGQFAFQVFYAIEHDGSEGNTMQPRDPSLQNRRRQAQTTVGQVTIGL